MEPFSRVAFEKDLVRALGIEGGEASEEYLKAFLQRYFGVERAAALRTTISEDMRFFRSLDPASTSYTEMQILTVRRGMAAITAHRLFQELLARDADLLYDVEVIAKYVQKDTNVEIHPAARIGVPFAIDHGHGTVIGATAEVGSRTFIYHGVTLGASRHRSKTQRRHPRVGNDAYFGNGSQILGPCILEDSVHVACDVDVRDSFLSKGVSIALGVRVASVIVPADYRIFGFDQADLTRYAVSRPGGKGIEWAEFERFVPEEYE